MKSRIQDKQINNELQGIILICFGLLIFKLFLSQQISLILSPKMIPFTAFSMIAFFILGAYRMFSNDSMSNGCGCDGCDTKSAGIKRYLQYSILFILPLVIGFNLESYNLSLDSITKRGVSSDVTLRSDGDLLSEVVNFQEKTIEVTDSNFFKVMQVLNENMQEVEGFTINMKGFVYRDVNFNENEAVIARQAMSCCVADSSVFGYMLKGEVNTLETGKWYELKGRVENIEMGDEMTPVIKVISTKEMKEPKELYIYII
ncbi:TIGR03943 family protein [Cytobacillus horneckiae]|uniref:TIGR03943 family putative permease subunit n=1 Tax=Cytobacillus horneckiae TaxID=549687 RepID=UPI00399F0D6B